MFDPLFLALIANIFLLGILSVLGVLYGYSHLSARRLRKKPDAPQKLALPPAVKQELLSAAEHEYQGILDRSANELQKDLQKTTTSLSKQLTDFGTSVIKDEVSQYQDVIKTLRADAESTITESQKAVTTLHESMKQQVAEQVEKEKQQLLANIDTKLGDAIGSFLSENLQHNIDLGTQTEYILSVLEEHKDELKEAINGNH